MLGKFYPRFLNTFLAKNYQFGVTNIIIIINYILALMSTILNFCIFCSGNYDNILKHSFTEMLGPYCNPFKLNSIAEFWVTLTSVIESLTS